MGLAGLAAAANYGECIVVVEAGETSSAIRPRARGDQRRSGPAAIRGRVTRKAVGSISIRDDRAAILVVRYEHPVRRPTSAVLVIDAMASGQDERRRAARVVHDRARTDVVDPAHREQNLPRRLLYQTATRPRGAGHRRPGTAAATTGAAGLPRLCAPSRWFEGRHPMRRNIPRDRMRHSVRSPVGKHRRPVGLPGALGRSRRTGGRHDKHDRGRDTRRHYDAQPTKPKTPPHESNTTQLLGPVYGLTHEHARSPQRRPPSSA